MKFKKEHITEDLNAVLVCTKQCVIHSVPIQKDERIVVRKDKWFSCYHGKNTVSNWSGFTHKSPTDAYEHLRYAYKNEYVNPQLLVKLTNQKW